MPDGSTPRGAALARRLQSEMIIWLTTVSASGAPVPTPVWFLWDGATFLVYSLPDARRVRHIAGHPRVALNLDTAPGEAASIVAIDGEARIAEGEPTADKMPAYLEKYSARIARIGHTPSSFALKYATAIRIAPAKVRGR
jgi:PPOX class probable F420-dependent enzyme